MGPKEKARELFQIYLDIVLNAEADRQEVDEAAKECALIAADELIECCSRYDELNETYVTLIDYWKKVKQEIMHL